MHHCLLIINLIWSPLLSFSTALLSVFVLHSCDICVKDLCNTITFLQLGGILHGIKSKTAEFVE